MYEIYFICKRNEARKLIFQECNGNSLPIFIGTDFSPDSSGEKFAKGQLQTSFPLTKCKISDNRIKFYFGSKFKILSSWALKFS